MTFPSAAIVLALVICSGASASGQARTDVVTLINGDRITGEILSLGRGQLELKTDNAGTIEIEWDKIAGVEATRQFDVTTADGRRFLGGLGRVGDGFVLIVGGENVRLPMPDVTNISPIGASFWAKLDGSVNGGFNYTRSSGIAQATFNSDTAFRRPAFAVLLVASTVLTYRSDDDDTRSDQATMELSYERYRGRRLFIAGAGRLETNESLGLVLRSQVAGMAGYRFVNTNRAQFQTGAGLVLNNEQGVDTESTQNVEGLLALKWSYYTYDRPKTNVDVAFQYYPSVSNPGRHRLQFNAAVRRELLRDLYVGLNAYDTFDSAPPNPDAAHNDVGLVATIGWSF